MIKKILNWLILSIVALQANSQVSHKKYCECKTGQLLADIKYSDSLLGVVQEDSNTYSIKIINTTGDTLFLFSSYLDDQFFNSVYLKRLNRITKGYKISFTPIIPFVSTKRSDNIIITNSIVKEDQIVYDFVRLLPNTYYEFKIPLTDAFITGKAIKDFAPKKLNKLDYKTKFEEASITKDIVHNYKKLFEFAIYKNVSFLCKESNYFLKENEFNKKAKDFFILQVPVNK